MSARALGASVKHRRLTLASPCELEVGRRTAERLRDSLAAMFPQMECWDDDERVRRWRLPGSALVGVVEPRPEAVATIETSARECAMRGEADRAALLREASTTLKAVMRPDALRRAEPDIAALMEAEGIAMRPGPRPVIAAGVLPALRRAILGMQLVVVRYAGPDAEEPAARILCPYGILYGGRGWLVAHVDELPEMRLWRLDRIVSIDLLDRGFARREDFDLSAYAAQSFGVFQEEPIDVVLRFTPEAADGPLSASHGLLAGLRGPIPCVRRQRSEGRRAFSRRAAAHEIF